MTDRTDQPIRQHSPVPTHAPHLHADTTGMHYTCTACTYTTPHVRCGDPAAAEAILRHCGHPVRRIPAGTIHAAKATLSTAQQLLHRRRPLGYTRAWRLRLRAASAHATLRAGGAL